MPDKVCQCGHAHEAHTHYRRGTDCGICGAEICKAFSAARTAAAPASAPTATSAGATSNG